ncbi:hypothetical protein HGRIS_003169 [Hohenbuehelia grisea]|uniref:Thioredoxin-like protein AAED1 n=1 Tax=Hohenbuehelia grisea TaxID=104357 RepID=A0ABR3JMW8_9AGAR
MATTQPKEIPDSTIIEKASKLEVYDAKGAKVVFGSLFSDQKIIAVFIRHFFCGTCKMYVEQLASIPKETLESANAKIVVVGCGEWNPIKGYASDTGFAGDIYADPSLELYHTLGMNVESIDGTPAGQEKRTYVTRGRVSNIVSSIVNGPLRHPTHLGKQGNWSQLGGDFILGPGLKCTFASRMQHTEDHVEVSELVKIAGAKES